MATVPGETTVVYVTGNGTADAQDVALPVPALAASAQWFNPARDEPLRPIASVGATGGGTHVRTPGDNGSGTNDWVIVD
jgi:hypothetical protein